MTDIIKAVRSIKNDILHSTSFLNINAKGVSSVDTVRPTIATGTAISRTSLTRIDIHITVSPMTDSKNVNIAKHSVIMGTIFFTIVL